MVDNNVDLWRPRLNERVLRGNVGHLPLFTTQGLSPLTVKLKACGRQQPTVRCLPPLQRQQC